MRISPYITQIELSAMSAANQAEETALLQLTTGKRVNVASDDPSAAAREVAVSSQSSDCDQFLRSISSVSAELQTADSALSSGVTALQQAISLGVEGANGTLSQDDRNALANEVQSISQQMMGIANLSYNGKYVFAGTADSQPPYVVAAGVVTYQGNNTVNQVEIEAGQTIAVNQPGSQLFSAAGASVFQSLSDLAAALQSSSSTTDDIANATNEVKACLHPAQLRANVLRQHPRPAQCQPGFPQQRKASAYPADQRPRRRGHEPGGDQPGQRRGRA